MLLSGQTLRSRMAAGEPCASAQAPRRAFAGAGNLYSAAAGVRWFMHNNKLSSRDCPNNCQCPCYPFTQQQKARLTRAARLLQNKCMLGGVNAKRHAHMRALQSHSQVREPIEVTHSPELTHKPCVAVSTCQHCYCCERCNSLLALHWESGDPVYTLSTTLCAVPYSKNTLSPPQRALLTATAGELCLEVQLCHTPTVESLLASLLAWRTHCVSQAASAMMHAANR